jgi:hypothetical protein
MSITYGDHLIDSGYYDITPEQEREIEAREECERRGIDPDELCADGGVEAWMVVAKELARPRPHPADGMTVEISLGGGAYSTIINPLSFEDGGPEWVMRYGNPESIRYSVASLLSTYDYLLSDAINMTEATRRLRIMRAERRALLSNPTQGNTR